ncbi:hypothetical protein Q5752_003758 [Cryptotrichosporon argae]
MTSIDYNYLDNAIHVVRNKIRYGRTRPRPLSRVTARYIRNYRNRDHGSALGYAADAARSFAKASSEVLFLGRIFHHDVQLTMTLTSHDCDVDIPEYFFIPPRRQPSDHWIDNLV